MNSVRKKTKIKNIQEVIEKSSLVKIIDKGVKIIEINQKLSQFLSVEYRHKIRLANIRNQIACLECQSAAIRYGIQFQQHKILEFLQQCEPTIKKLEIKVNPNYNFI